MLSHGRHFVVCTSARMDSLLFVGYRGLSLSCFARCTELLHKVLDTTAGYYSWAVWLGNMAESYNCHVLLV